MKVLIVAKTRRGGGACVGGITQDGLSVRLIAPDAATNERAGLEYEVGEVWEVDSAPDPDIAPPHVENLIVLSARRLRRSHKLEETIHRFMPPVSGSPEKLFDGLTQATSAGGLYIAESTGLPRHSTMFWLSDKPLQLDCEGKRIHYRYPTPDGGRRLTFVGFQEPLAEIPAGTLLRVSLAHRWRPQDRPGEEMRCFVQLSGWFLKAGHPATGQPQPMDVTTPAAVPGSASRPPAVAPGRTLEVLKQAFGFSQFLPLQAEIVARVLRRQDTLVVMPTGGGKSLCYQLPALLFDGLTVVVSPLVALMQDQVRQLHELDVPAACLNHMVPVSEWTTVTSRVRGGSIKILYLAPETLLRPETLLLLEQSNLSCLAVDEAHCISEWGHDFRPEYRQLRGVRRRFPHAVCLMLTATATARVRADVRGLLGIPVGGEFVASFNRPNLFVAVEPRHDGLAQILAFLANRHGQSGIIYCGKRKQTEELCAALKANGWPALPYHAGMEDDARRRNQDRFIRDDAPLIVATIAFGMGINKPNVRFVIHAHLPKDLESYYQEIGRAGRDGLPAQCLLLYSRADAVVHRLFIDQGAASERPGRQARLNALMRFAETRDCRRVPLLAYFGETLTPPCGHCDNCSRTSVPSETVDVTDDARKFLSCAQLTGEMFGPAHIIAVLRGSKAGRVLARRHDRLAVFGAGKEHSQEHWRELVQQFLQMGLVDQDLEFGGLRLTAKGRDALRGGAKVLVPLTDQLMTAAPEAPAGADDPALFEHLRQLRRELADLAQVPAYIIFSDRALSEMAARKPQTEAQLLDIHGVGQAKFARYGTRFLELIRSHCQASDGTDKAPKVASSAEVIVRPVSKRRCHEIGELFAAGGTLEDMGRRFEIKKGTVVENLRRFLEAGGHLDPDHVLQSCSLPEPQRALVLEALERLGLERLGPVHAALSGAVRYDELHLLRLYLLACERGKA